MIDMLNGGLLVGASACIGINFAALRVLASKKYRCDAHAWRVLSPVVAGMIGMTVVLCLMVEV